MTGGESPRRAARAVRTIVTAPVVLAVVTALGACSLLGTTTPEEADRRPARAEAARSDDTPTPTPTPTKPSPSLKPLKQPSEEWKEPELLEDPGEGATTLKRLEYVLVTQVWVAAGVRAATEVNCDLTEEELAEPGTYEYECIVTYDDVDVPYSVETETTEEISTSVPRTDFTVMTKKKALHELKRQAIEPAKVSCKMAKVQLVLLGTPDALRCSVTDAGGRTYAYGGEVSGDGAVFFTAS